MMSMYWTPSDDGEHDVAKVIACFVVIALVLAIMMAGCSASGFVGVRGETFYPDDWKKGGDPAPSRSAGVDLTSSSTPGRPPIPGGN